MIWDVVDKEKHQNVNTPYQGSVTDFGDAFASALEYTLDNQNIGAAERLKKNAFDDNVKALKELDGDSFDIRLSPSYKKEEFEFLDTSRPHENLKKDNLYKKYVNDLIIAKKQEDPEKYKNILTEEETVQRARDKAKESERQYFDVMARSDTPKTSFLGGLVGGFTASMVDPVNAATLPIGAGLGKNLFKTVLIEAGANMAVEAASQQFVEQWQKEIGNDYGMKDKAEAVGLAGLFGGAFPVATKTLGMGARAVFSKVKSLDNLTPEVKAAMATLERSRHFEETNPYVYSGSSEKHLKAYDEIVSALNRGEKIEFKSIGISNKSFNDIDTRILPNDGPMEIRRKMEILNFQDEEFKLSPEQHQTRNDLILDEIENMRHEVEQAQVQNGLVTTQGGEKTRFYSNTYPEWYKTIGTKNKKDFYKLIENQKGKRYERIRAVAEERLRDGYESPITGRNLPDETFLRASVPEKAIAKDTGFKFSDTKAEAVAPKETENISLSAQREANKKLESPEHMKSTETEFNRILEENKNMKYVIEDEDGNELVMSAKAVKEMLEEDENMIKALSSCGIGA